MAERFMQPLAKAIRVNGQFSPHFEHEVKEFTRSYNATPQSSTGFAPRELLYKSRTSSTRLPVFHKPPVEDEVHGQVHGNDQYSKATAKAYTDARLKVKDHSFEVGQEVLQKQRRKNKTDSPFDPDPFIITGVKGSMIEISRHGSSYCRNSSDLKSYIRPDSQTVQEPRQPRQLQPLIFRDIQELYELCPEPLNAHENYEAPPTPEATLPTTSRTRNRQRSQSSSVPRERLRCDHCEGSYLPGTGMRVHLGRMQPNVARASRVEVEAEGDDNETFEDTHEQ